MTGRGRLTIDMVRERRVIREAAFGHAYDRVEIRNIIMALDLGDIFERHGWPERVTQAQRKRVEALLAQDRLHRHTEALREAATIEFENGKSVAIVDVVTGPTPEQIAKAEREGAGFDEFTPRLEDGTVVTVKGYKRRDVPQAYKLMFARVIGLEEVMAAKWYRALFERTGLDGTMASTDYTREVFTAPHSRDAFTQVQAEAQDEWRRVRAMIPSRYLRLLDQLLIEDVPLKRAVRAARAFHRNPKKGAAEAFDQLVSIRDELREP